MKAKTRAGRAGVIHIQALSRAAARGALAFGGLRLPCALGRTGRRALKREGDGAAPIGCWPLRRVFYRADRLKRPRTALPLSPLRPGDAWRDEPGDRNYNRFVRGRRDPCAETMWRDDHLYDIVVVIGYNDWPRVRGRGSAIFMHLARPGYAPTAGCVALSLKHLLLLLGRLPANARIDFG